MDKLTTILDKFKNLPDNLRQSLGDDRAIAIINDLERRYQITDLGLLVMFIGVGELKMEDIEYYLQRKYKLNQVQAQRLNQELQQFIFQPAMMNLLEDLVEQDNSLGLNDYKTSLTKAFGESFISLVQMSNDQINTVNNLIINIIENDNVESKTQEFNQVLAKILNESSEKIGSKRIRVNGRNIAPTIGNWIDDFNDKNGSGFFTALVLSDYLVNSDNVKKLTEAEKDILRKVLITYRNLKHFKESMDNLPVDSWQIIPLVSSSSKFGTKVASDKSISSTSSEELTELEKRFIAEENK